MIGKLDDSSPEEKPYFVHGLRDVNVDEHNEIIMGAPFVGNPIPEVTWSKDGETLRPSDRLMMTCDGRKVGLEIKSAKLEDAGSYTCKLSSPLGENSSTGRINVKKTSQPPKFNQKFTDLQQVCFKYIMICESFLLLIFFTASKQRC